MKLESGENLQLNGVSYRVGDRIGGGAVADVYRACLVDLPDAEVIIKMAREDASDDPLKLEGIRSEGKVLEALNRVEDAEWATYSTVSARLTRARLTENRRRIIALYDAGAFANGKPFLVQEMAPPTFVRFPIENLADEERMIAVASAIAQVMTRVHELGFALKDFEPVTKGDRIRVKWLDPVKGEFALKIIDWNVTGSVADVPQDLVYFGRHLYYFLLGSHVRLDFDDLPPADLEASSPNWRHIREGSQQILRRALHRDPRRRYQRASNIESDLAWWLGMLQIAGQPGAAERLKDRLWQARTEVRHDRVLAVAGLALEGELPTDQRISFERPQQQAREELDKEDWLPLASARSTLLTGAFARAVEEFSQLLLGLPPSSEAARRSRIFQCLAALGSEYGQGQIDRGLQKTRAWEPLLRAAGHLAERRWTEGVQALFEADRYESGLSARQPFAQLLGIAKCGQLDKEANDKFLRAVPLRQEAERPDWAEVEQRQILIQREAVSLLRQAWDAAPLEPELGARLRAEEERLKEREVVFNDYQDADRAIASWDSESQKATEAQRERQHAAAAAAYENAFKSLEVALNRWESIAGRDPEQYRARLMRDRWLVCKGDTLNAWRQALERARIGAQTDQALAEAKEALAKGEYSLAVRKVRAAAESSPDRRDVQDALVAAESGERFKEQSQSELTTVFLYVRLRNLSEAKLRAEKIMHRHGRSFEELGEKLGTIGGMPFLLPTDIREGVARIQQFGPRIEQIKEAADEAAKTSDYAQLIHWLDQLREQLAQLNETLIDEELQQRDRALSRLDTQAEVSKILDAAPTLENLESALEKLNGDESLQAAALRKRIGDAWDALALQAKDLAALRSIAVEGARRLFGDRGEKWKGRSREVERLTEVQAGLAVTEGDSWPAWFGRDDCRGRLEDIGRQLRDLLQGGWPPAIDRAKQLQNALAGAGGYLPAYAASCEKLARDQARRSEFEAAAETAARALAIFRSQPVDGLPTQLSDGLNGLKSTLEARLTAKGIINDTLRGLATGAIPPTDADVKLDEALQTLPTDPDVPVATLQELLRLGRELSKARSYPSRDPAEDGYARYVHEGQDRKSWLESIQAPGGWVGEMPAEMRTGIVALQEDIKNAQNRAANTPADRLKFKIEELRGKPAPSPADADALLALHWQAIWLRDSGALNAADLPDLAALPRLILDKAWTVFTEIKRPQDLERASDIVRAAARLNDGLLTPGEHQKLLPGLADGRTLSVGERPLATESLLALLAELSHLRQLDQRTLADAPTTPEKGEGAPEPTGEEVMLDRTQTCAREVRACLDVLKGAAWAPQDLTEWPAESAPGQLSAEADLHERLVQALHDARRCLPAPPQPPEAIQGLAILDAQVASPGNDARLNEYGLWLLEPGRNALRTIYPDLRERLRDAVIQQVEAAFKDPVAPAQILKAKVLEPVKSRGVAELVSSAILVAVETSANQDAGTPVPPQARSGLLKRLLGRDAKTQPTAMQRDRWRIVKDATASWVPGASPTTSEGKGKALALAAPAGQPPPLRRLADGDPPQPRPEPTEAAEPPRGPEVTPDEVAEIWRTLHLEAVARLKDLRPHISRRLIAITIAVVGMIIVAAVWYGITKDNQQEEWIVQATKTAIAQSTSEAQTREAQAIAGTRTAEALFLKIAETQTAQAEEIATDKANRLATATELERTDQQTRIAATRTQVAAIKATETTFAAMVTAQAVGVQATQEALRCQSADRYRFELLTGPEFTPPPLVQLVKGDQQPLLSATWMITNTGDCAMERVRLWSSDGLVQPRLFDAEGRAVERIEAGTSGKITIRFAQISPTQTYKFTLAVNDSLVLVNLPQFTLDAAKWVRVVTPTPTPSPTYTSTPTPTPPIICEDRPRWCNCIAKQDGDGNPLPPQCETCYDQVCSTATPGS